MMTTLIEHVIKAARAITEAARECARNYWSDKRALDRDKPCE